MTGDVRPPLKSEAGGIDGGKTMPNASHAEIITVEAVQTFPPPVCVPSPFTFVAFRLPSSFLRRRRAAVYRYGFINPIMCGPVHINNPLGQVNRRVW